MKAIYIKLMILLSPLSPNLAVAKGSPIIDLPILEARSLINDKIMDIEAIKHPVHSVQDIVIENDERQTPIRVYKPTQEGQFPVVLLIHGGAWIAGTLDTHDNLARYIASKTHSLVVSVGYTNSPEGKFALILEQCYDALTWVTDKREALQINDYTSVVGDSAGGNIAAALGLMSAERHGPKIDNLVLINPAVDLRCQGSLDYDNSPLDMMRWKAKLYTHHPLEVNHEYVSPIVSTRLSDLPPTLVILAEHDNLYEDGYHFSEKLKRANVATEVYIQKNIGHLAGDGARASEKAKPSLDKAVEYLLASMEAYPS